MVRGNSWMCRLSLGLPKLAALHFFFLLFFFFNKSTKLKPHVKCWKELRPASGDFSCLNSERKIILLLFFVPKFKPIKPAIWIPLFPAGGQGCFCDVYFCVHRGGFSLLELGHPQYWTSRVVAQIHPQHLKAVKRLRASQCFHPAI